MILILPRRFLLLVLLLPEISSAGAAALAQLSSMANLTVLSLDLRDNQIDSSGAAALGITVFMHGMLVLYQNRGLWFSAHPASWSTLVLHTI